MSDIAHKYTDEEIEALERKFAEVYKQALQEMESKASAYFEEFEIKDEQKRAEWGMGVISDKEYYSWRQAQMTKGEKYTNMVNQLSSDMSNTNQMAMAALGERLPDIYAMNSNYQAYEMCQETGANIAFDLVDHHTVEKLVKEDSDLLPKPRVNIPEDEKWNQGKIRSALTQGILQGDSISNISKRLQQVTDMNRRASVRNARTMCTGAENAGRLSRYKEAEDRFGLLFDKIWMATHDGRTRDSHKAIDEEQVPSNEEFSNGLMYPADPDGEPAEVYNCRCTMRSEFTGKKSEVQEEFGEMNPNESFEEWEEEKKEEEKVEIEKIEPFEMEKLKKSMKEEDYKEFLEIAQNSPNAKLYRDYGDKVKYIFQSKSNGYYSNWENTLDYSLEQREGRNKFSCLAHEYNHLFDDRNKRREGLNFSEVDLINEKTKVGSGIVKTIDALPSSSNEFISALRADMEALNAKGLAEIYSEFKGIKFNSTAGVQDALDGFYGTRKKFHGWGHGDRYYNREYNNKIKSFNKEKELKEAFTELGFDASNQTKCKQLMRQYEAASEAWANVGSAVTCGGAELEAIAEYMPETLKAYLEIVGGF